MMSLTVRRAASFIMLLAALFLILGLISSAATELQLTFAPNDLQFQVGDSKQFEVFLSSQPNETFDVNLIEDKAQIVSLSASNVAFHEGHLGRFNVTATGHHPGSLVVYANGSRAGIYDASQAFVRIKVKVHGYLDTLSDIIGWIYFVAWSISFYPQVYLNIKRRSVVGLHLDYMAMNIVGFLCYSLFNCGLYFNKEIQAEYFEKNPRGVNPVQLNDVVFALHAVFGCVIILLQAIIFERAGQKVSKMCLTLLGISFVFIGISFVITLEHVINWLTFLYYVSYVKLSLTVVKYIPQAYYNFKRKSTVGWAIGNVLLDCTGGVFSMLQMFIISYNYDDWASLFGDPTKFGLGFVSILFDLLFMVQHYVLYRDKHSEIGGVSTNMSPSAYKIMTQSTSRDNILRVDPNVHRPYQVQESPDNNDHVVVNGLQ